jgi:hypothetical protein|tara:strand:+ start:3433 stop:3807 length:375 start_codon:yes stop_codon:yes gene_type:complete
MNKRKIPRAFFEPLEAIQASDLLENESLLDLVKNETPLAIEEAFRNKKTFATLFEVNGIGLYLDIPKQYWIPALEQCISFKLTEEKFEDCIKLRDLIEEIRKPIKKIPKKKDNGTTVERNTDSN